MLPLLVTLALFTTTQGLVLPQNEGLTAFTQFQQPMDLVDKITDKITDKLSDKLDKLRSKVPILKSSATDKLIPQKYIVVFKESVAKNEAEAHYNWITKSHKNAVATMSSGSADIDSITSKLEFFGVGSMKGYIGYFPKALINEISEKTDVIEYIEQDSIVSIKESDIQKNAPWGLSRISHRGAAVSPKLDYLFDNEGGKGVTAYVIDTGIKVQHEEFENRAIWGKAVAVPFVKYDANGHGTHVAGTIGSKTYGVAKNVDLVAVGVMNLLGSGTIGDIIKGLEYVVADHNERSKSKGHKGSTVNMSIGGGESEALDAAVNAGTAAGLHIAVAAGNENADACGGSPSRARGPICVGATNSRDEKASFSNWGSCVDIFAPGEDIISTYIWGETTSMSGTSMATPHITGLLSYYLSLQPEESSEFATKVTPALLKDKLIKYGTKGVITGLDTASPNVLAYNGGGGNLTEFWFS